MTGVGTCVNCGDPFERGYGFALSETCSLCESYENRFVDGNDDPLTWKGPDDQ
jgi:hypothetical protein